MESRIFSALHIPAAAPRPSINCIQWSGDGQLVITTRSAVWILTPDLGINYDNVTLMKSVARVHERKDVTHLDLGWHKNLIEFDRSIVHQWAAETPEWGALVLGSLDVSWRSVTASPSNMTTNAGCLLVSLNSNSEVSLWHSTRNHLKEPWLKVQDVTAVLKEDFLQGNRLVENQEQRYLQALHAQVNCVAWSQQADFGLTPNPLVDGSILALGNRAGSVVLMRFDGHKSLYCIKVLRIADEWITELTWGNWKSVEPFRSEAYLACSVSDGSIILVKVTQNLEQRSSLSPFRPEFDVRCDVHALDVKPSQANGKSITALSWVEVDEFKGPILVHANPGVLRFFRLDVMNQSGSHELTTLRLITQKTSVGSSSFNPVVGIRPVRGLDTLIVTLFDGSYHVVQNVSTNPTLIDKTSMEVDGEEDTSLSSASLSHAARKFFVAVEAASMKFSDVNATNGVAEFDGSGTVAWLHEASRPNDFSYKADSARYSMLVVAHLFKAPNENETIIGLIKDTIERPKAFLGHAPIHTLRPVYLHLSRKDFFDKTWSDVLWLLPLSNDKFEQADIEPWSGTVDHNVLKSFQHSLSVDLYGWDIFHSLRYRLAIADFCWKLSAGDVREQFGKVAHSLLGTISHRFLKVLVKHLMAVVGSMTEQDIPFVMRIVVQSLLEDSPPSLATKADELNAALRARFSNCPEAFDLNEPCPACSSQIPLKNLLEAECPQGHTWARCSITTFVLSTPRLRTCIGCTRKAFVAPSSRESANADTLMWIPEAGRGWIVDALLEAAHCCLYCGNRFIRIL